MYGRPIHTSSVYRWVLSFIIHQSRRHHVASRCILTNNVMFRIKEEGSKVDRRYIPVSPRLVWTSWVLVRVQIVLGIMSCIIRSAGNLSQNYIFRTIDRTIFRKAVEFSFHVDQCFFSVRSRQERSQDQLYKVSIYPTYNYVIYYYQPLTLWCMQLYGCSKNQRRTFACYHVHDY